jgi:hypothetical protein
VLSSGQCGDPFGDHPTGGASQVGFPKKRANDPITLKNTEMQTAH